MSKLYVIVGTQGEYSDRTEWNVAAYADEQMARQHAEKALAWYRENVIPNRSELRSQKNPYDPGIVYYFSGDDADYTVCEVELRTEVPE